MDRIRGGNAIPTLHAEIIPPQATAASFSRASRTIDVYPEFPSVAVPLKGTRPRRQWPHRRGIRLLLWLALAIAVLAIVVLALRGPIVEHLPGTAGIYRAVGIQTAPTGPTLEDVSVIRIYSRGSVLLTVEGTVANATGRQIDIPPMSLFMLDANETALETIVLSPLSTRLDPNGSTRFTTEIANPPGTMASLAIQIGDGPIQPVIID